MKLERILLFVVTTGIQLTLCCAGKQSLNEYIEHYEGLSYSTEALHSKHVRAKRSLNTAVNLHFISHGREFNLRLKRDTSTFTPDAQLKQSDGSLVDLDVSHIYEGHVVGEPNSYVHGSIIDGIFSGKIRTQRATYYVDKSELYFKEPQKFHSVIYSQDNMNTDPFRHKRDTRRGTCGSTDSKIRQWMQSVQNSAVVEKPVEKRDVGESAQARWTERANIYTEALNREKRATQPPKLTCHMFLQSDPELWNYMTKSAPNGLGYSEARANEEITSLLSQHVSGIKTIYENTMFVYESMSYQPVSFVVHRMQVNNTAKVCTGNADEPRFCEQHIDVSNFLNLHSLTDHHDFCLAFVFTYRDFTGGTLGLAWVGSPTGASGGICDKHKLYEENGQKVKKSLNTGIITLLNYGQRVPPRISTLTFAHEVGHNFGSPHDSGDECTPYSKTPRDPKGNYIMYASATSGDKDNNDHFSPCSVRNMTLVIDAVVLEKHGKKQCFRETNAPFCGNKIVEDGERCDCGYNDADCGASEIKCCYPRSHKTLSCTLKTTASCSATQGPCCNATTCGMIPEAANLTCADENECSFRVACNGSTATCPRANPKPNNTACNQNTQICQNGVCSGSICKRIGSQDWEQCYITEKPGEKVDRANMCYVACTNPSTDTCVSSADKSAMDDPANKEFKHLLDVLRKENIQLQPGAPCDNYRGYCDVFQKCRGIDSDGPLARLKKLLLSAETLDKVKDWIIAHWWVVLLIAIGVVVFMGLFIHLCAVHTPSSNPNKPPPRKLSLRRHPRHSNHPQGRAPQQGPSRSVSRSTNPPPYNSGYEMKHPYRRS